MTRLLHSRITHKILVDVHATDVAVRVFARVAVGALALAKRELHVVQVSASERLGTTGAADGSVDEEVRQMRTLVQ